MIVNWYACEYTFSLVSFCYSMECNCRTLEVSCMQSIWVFYIGQPSQYMYCGEWCMYAQNRRMWAWAGLRKPVGTGWFPPICGQTTLGLKPTRFSNELLPSASYSDLHPFLTDSNCFGLSRDFSSRFWEPSVYCPLPKKLTAPHNQSGSGFVNPGHYTMKEALNLYFSPR